MTESIRGWLVPIGVAVLIIGLVAIALVREPALLDPDTPEGTVQIYLQAISDGDFEGAFEVLDPEFYEGCDASSLATHRQEVFTARIEDNGQPVSGDTAFVGVSMTFGDGGAFGSQWTTEEVFTVVSHDGSWSITGEDVWPYFAWDCVNRVDG